jgi:hypothetical protein
MKRTTADKPGTVFRSRSPNRGHTSLSIDANNLVAAKRVTICGRRHRRAAHDIACPVELYSDDVSLMRQIWRRTRRHVKGSAVEPDDGSE